MRPDADRLEAAYAEFAAAVNWLARKRSVPRELAEDAVQEALLQLVERSDQLGLVNLGGWIRHVAECRLVDADRHRRTQPPNIGEREWDEEALEPDLDTIIALRAAFRRLPRSSREIVVLRLADTPWSEIAERTGVDEEAARKRFTRSLIELRSAIGTNRD